MAAIQVGTAISFGVLAETGAKLQSFEIKEVRDKKEVKNENGDVVTSTRYNPRFEINASYHLTSASGFGAASTGVVITMANFTPAAGGIYSEEITTKLGNEEYKKVDLKAINNPLIN